jgi:light-regulated signal transduction histidine kinase (bacteriophytochrome)
MVDLNELVNEILILYHKQIQEEEVILKIGPLPVMTTFGGPMRQVLQNLISNSLKYQKEGIVPEIDISGQEAEGHWQFVVSDNGIGIDPQYFDKIFVIFQRLHTKAEYLGTGMGLAITKKIVENWGGRIWVESAENKGSSFYFTIPKYNTSGI